EEGLAEGDSEDISDGLEEGLAEGDSEDISDGLEEGLAEGDSEDISDGLEEGLAEGDSEDISVSDGLEEGLAEAEGDSEGISVGGTLPALPFFCWLPVIITLSAVLGPANTAMTMNNVTITAITVNPKRPLNIEKKEELQ
ncbi:hypothetical protein ACHAWC_007830, partial [Mediolabrus comicus]